ncbi:hypothetical protein SAMN05519103_03344 [Rhizobiales bacterium GAS113]|nr:hypothetical protein SAMN05519103_03344 [Rhizobiales bacterium GAS113]
MGQWFRLEKVPQILAALTASILCLSIIHDEGFYWIVGRQFQELMGPSDYLSGALHWLPVVVIAVMLAGIAQLSVNRYRNFEKRRTPRRRRQINKTFIGALLVLIAIYVAMLLLHFFTISILVDPMILIFVIVPPWMTFWGWIFTHEKPARFLGAIGGMLVIGVVPLSVTIFTLGMWDAGRALSSIRDVYEVKGKDGGPKFVAVLRSLDRGMILFDPVEDNVRFEKWDDIKSFGHKSFYVDARPTSCMLFHLNCPFEAGPP